MRHHKSRRGIAVHEAGHAVAFLALDIWFSEVAIYTSPKMSDRGVMYYGGVTGDTDIIYQSIYLAMSSLAGPVAQAKFRKQSLLSALLSGGRADFEYVKECVATGQYNCKFIEQETKKLVAFCWRDIMSVADALMQHSTLRWGDVARLAPLACAWKETERYNHISRIVPHRAKQQ